MPKIDYFSDEIEQGRHPSCSTCDFCNKAKEDGPDGGLGECRCDSPMDDKWPIVSLKHGWCGEWQRTEGVEGIIWGDIWDGLPTPKEEKKKKATK